MKRLLLLLPLLLLGGCAPDRKAQLETILPQVVSKEMQRLASPSNTNATAICKQVTLVRESDGHYKGTAFFTDGRQTQVSVLDDGESYQLTTDPF